MRHSRALFVSLFSLAGFAFLVFFAACIFTPLPAEAALPKSSFAVLANGPSAQHTKSTEALITRQLLAKGYKVVDPKKLDAIRRDRAARLALEGNVDAILKLSSGHGATMIVVQVEAGRPVVNEFKLYTGTASLAVTVGAPNGSIIYADTVSGKQVGYTPDEAAQKSIESAATRAVAKMTE